MRNHILSPAKEIIKIKYPQKKVKKVFFIYFDGVVPNRVVLRTIMEENGAIVFPFERLHAAVQTLGALVKEHLECYRDQ